MTIDNEAVNIFILLFSEEFFILLRIVIVKISQNFKIEDI